MAKAVFLDRDGIINIDKGYIHKKEDVEFVGGIFELCRFVKEKGFHIFVVTNQAGIDKGLYGHDDVAVLHSWMKDEFALRGIDITEMYYCSHHPDFTGACLCRKPEPGMLLQAVSAYGIDAPHSVMIGDKISDVKAGKNAGVGLNILVKSQYADEKPEEADVMFASVAEVYEYLKKTF